MFQSVAHIGFTITDVEKSIAFYRDVLGLTYLGKMKMGGPETAALFQRENCEATVAYLQTADKSAPPVELIQFTNQKIQIDTPDLFKTSISELCFETNDIDAEYIRLKKLGVEFISSPQTFDSTEYGFGKSRAVYFYDLDKNILELIQPIL